METYAKVLLYAIPSFLVLVMLEMAYGHFIKDQKHYIMDTISSLSSGLTNIIKDSLGIVLVIVSYPFLVKHLAIFEVQATWLVYVIGFITLDFGSYWNHRLSHKINFFWNQHVIHHSSEEFNLGCALRQSISNLLGYFPILLFPAAIAGVPPKVIAFLAPVHLFAQFWYHTQHIGKLGWLEYIIVTPSQHRVHHAINEEYIDKNLAAIFCVWDRLFGTFQEELDTVPPVYGVLKPAQTWNPFLINFQHLYRLAFDAWHTQRFSDKVKIWFMPTGWRPADVNERFPRPIIEDPFNFKKYRIKSSKLLITWSLFQLISTTALLLFMYYNFAEIGVTNLLIYGLILGVIIYAFTSLMDGSKQALIAQLIATGMAFYILFNSGDWFGLISYWKVGPLVIGLFFGFSLLGTLLLLQLNSKKFWIKRASS
ncbi:MAG: sterol desaturase family protein [Flavobacteriaceae bacterium]|nr:sterol desaturase family protein [Flavobacteriaceae bacterium]